MRQAIEDDAPVLAALHVQAWQWAYRFGQLPDTFLNELSAILPRREAWRREAWRREMLAGPPGEMRVWVAEMDGRIVGFADNGPSRDADVAPETAEFSTRYLDPQTQVRRTKATSYLHHSMGLTPFELRIFANSPRKEGAIKDLTLTQGQGSSMCGMNVLEQGASRCGGRATTRHRHATKQKR